MQKNKKTFSGKLGKILGGAGNISIIYGILNGLKNLNSWDDIKVLVGDFSKELLDIFLWVGKVIHIICIPWDWLTSHLFSLLPFDIPEQLQDPIILVSFLVFIPGQLSAQAMIIRPTLASWKLFKELILPLFYLDPKEHEAAQIAKDINEQSLKFEFSKIQIYLVGAPFEYIIFLEKSVSNARLLAKQSEAINYLEKLEAYFLSLKNIRESFWKKKRLKVYLMLAVIVLVAIDRKLYVENFELLAFIGYVLLAAILVPLLIFIMLSLFGGSIVMLLNRTSNPLKRARLYDKLDRGIPILRRINRRLSKLVKPPESWLESWGQKLTVGQATLLVFQNERNVTAKFLSTPEGVHELKQKIKGKLWTLKSFRYSDRIAQILNVPVDANLEKTQLARYAKRLKLVKRISNYSDADWSILARHYLYESKLDEALESNNKAISLNPENFNFLILNGTLLEIKKDFPAALEVFEKALTIRPFDESVLNALGFLQLKMKRSADEVMYYFEKSVSLNPTNTANWEAKGVAENHLENYDEAIQSFTKVVELDPSNINGRLWIASLKNRLKDHAGSVQVLDELLAFAPLNYNALNERGGAKVKLEEYEEAIENLTAAILVNSTIPNAFAHRATANIALGNLDLASLDIMEALKIDPKFSRALYNQGLVLESQKKIKEACTFWEKAVENGFEEAKEKLEFYQGES